MTDQITAVFDYWRSIMGHARARLDDSRKKIILARLKDGYTVEDLCLAIDGNKASAWHQGENDRGGIYDGIELICRSASHVDKFIRAGEQAHSLIARRQQEEARKQAEEQATQVRTPEQIEKARAALASVKLRKVV